MAGMIVTALVVVLAGCGAPSLPRAVSEEGVYGPPTMGDWLEIDGRWEIVTDDGQGHLLLQPALQVDPDDDGPRDADVARWVDVDTGETIWERDDLSSVIYLGAERLVVSLGSGDSRAFAALDPQTGETLWSVPESEIGECTGWRLMAHWSYPEATDESAGDETPSAEEAEAEEAEEETPRLVLSAPPVECGNHERALLVELDPETGQHTEVLRGQGSIAVGWSDGHYSLVRWLPDSATVYFYDGFGEQVSTIDFGASELLEDTGLTTLSSPVELQFEQVFDERPWLRVVWMEDGTRHILNDFLLDPAEGTAARERYADCVPDQEDVAYRKWHSNYYYEDGTSLDFCLTKVDGADEAQMRTGSGDDATSWMAPVDADAAWWWQVTGCRGEVNDNQDDRGMLLGSAPDALVRAYDLLTGEVIWSLDEAPPGHVLVDTWRDPDRVIVLTEDADGRQLLRTLRLCTGEVLDEREVSGADMENGSITSSGWVVAVPLGETTLLAQFHERGEKPQLPVRAEHDPDDA